jgi:transcriptional regulator with XRE-family HTH domain
MLDPAVTSGPDRRRPLLRTMMGGVLRRIRLAQGRTLADVARAARVSMPYLSELERGRKEASSEVLAAICAALRIDLSDLLAEVGRELAGQRPAQVIRLDQARLDRARPDKARLDQAQPDQAQPDQAQLDGTAGRVAPPASRPGDAQCLLAA